MTKIARALDPKLFVDPGFNPTFATLMDDCFAQGRIVPFSILFSECQYRQLTEREKSRMEIIQFGFLVTNADGDLLLVDRVALSSTKQRGHTITLGRTALVGYSPVRTPEGRPHPMSEDDVLWAYHCEINDSGLGPRKLGFLGVVRNIANKSRYCFYVFEVRYTRHGSRLPVLLKETNDRVHGFVPVSARVLRKISPRKADLRAIGLLRGCDLTGLDLKGCDAVPHAAGALPPFLHHAPDVFISHTTPDDRVARRLQAVLEAAGFTCWADHISLKSGDPWFGEIGAMIKYGGCFVVLCSRASGKSKGVRDEIKLALERRQRDHNYPIIPLAIEGRRRESLIPNELIQFTAEDLRNPRTRPAGMNALVHEIHRKMGNRRRIANAQAAPSAPITALSINA